MLPRINETLPPSLKTSLLGDASVFVKQSVGSVAQEGIIAALLTSAMILLFLGSWRSTLIIAASIPWRCFRPSRYWLSVGKPQRHDAGRTGVGRGHPCG